ncbi:family 16 glycoside hydrolase [Gimesia sp.]|uniref:family 16 glycoside hydrolase n=1 Tax=Gimesia sp. TaxID=2024833 RepID=UPI0032F06AA5
MSKKRSNTESHNFNPYHKWLGIPEKKCPPTHYELLGISLDEDDLGVIRSAAKRQKSHVEQFLGTKYNNHANKLISQIDEAEITLVSPELRREYDRKVHLFKKRRKNRQIDPNVSPSSISSKGGRSVGEGGVFFREYAGIVAILAVAFFGMAAASFWLPWHKLTGSEKETNIEVAHQENTETVSDKKEPEKQVEASSVAMQEIPEPVVDSGQTDQAPSNANPEPEDKVDIVENDSPSEPQLIVHNELNGDPPNFAPWISQDGLSIYWTRGDSIWQAHRKNTSEAFGNQARLFEGFMPTVTQDGLSMVLSRQMKIGNKDLGRRLFFTNRNSTQDRFTAPIEIRELRDMGVVMAPCLSPDGLSLYMSCYGINENQKGHWVVTRKNRSSKWDINSKHRILPYPNPIPSTTPFVTSDGLSLFLTNRTNTSNGAFGEMIKISRESVNDPLFSKSNTPIKIGDKTLIGRFPRYCSSTKELFFSAPLSGSRESEGIFSISIENFFKGKSDLKKSVLVHLNGTYSHDGGLHKVTIEKLADSIYAVTLADGKTVSCKLNDNILSGNLGSESVTIAIDGPELTIIAFGDKNKFRKISNEIRNIPLATADSSQRMNEQTPLSLNGNWIAVAEENAGKSLTEKEIQIMGKTLYVKDDQFHLTWSNKEISGSVEYLPNQKPSAVNLSGRLGNRSIVLRGIYEIETDVMRFCYTASMEGTSNNQRPKTFNTKEVPNAVCVTYQRAHTLVPSQKNMADNFEPSGGKQISLFDGETLKGWKVVPGWEVRNGTIINTIPGKNLMTINEFREFELDLEFRLSDKGNSGVLLANGDEVQLIDDAIVAESSKKLEKIGKSFEPEKLCGAIFNRVAPNSVSYKGANEWNQLKIQVSNGKVSVQMNGVEVISKAPIVLRKGSIGLMTDKAGTARFRNIQIQQLD